MNRIDALNRIAGILSGINKAELTKAELNIFHTLQKAKIPIGFKKNKHPGEFPEEIVAYPFPARKAKIKSL